MGAIRKQRKKGNKFVITRRKYTEEKAGWGGGGRGVYEMYSGCGKREVPQIVAPNLPFRGG